MENKLIEALLLTNEAEVALLQDLSDSLDINETSKLMLRAIEEVKKDQGEDICNVNKETFILYLWRNAYLLGYQQALLDVIEAQREELKAYKTGNMKKRFDDHRQIEAENERKLQEWKNA